MKRAPWIILAVFAATSVYARLQTGKAHIDCAEAGGSGRESFDLDFDNASFKRLTGGGAGEIRLSMDSFFLSYTVNKDERIAVKSQWQIENGTLRATLREMAYSRGGGDFRFPLGQRQFKCTRSN